MRCHLSYICSYFIALTFMSSLLSIFCYFCCCNAVVQLEIQYYDTLYIGPFPQDFSNYLFTFVGKYAFQHFLFRKVIFMSLNAWFLLLCQMDFFIILILLICEFGTHFYFMLSFSVACFSVHNFYRSFTFFIILPLW